MTEIIGVGWSSFYKGYNELLKKCPGFPYVMTKYAGSPLKKEYNNQIYYVIILRCGWEVPYHIPGVTGTYLLNRTEYKYLAAAHVKRRFIEMMGPEFSEKKAKYLIEFLQI